MDAPGLFVDKYIDENKCRQVVDNTEIARRLADIEKGCDGQDQTFSYGGLGNREVAMLGRKQMKVLKDIFRENKQLPCTSFFKNKDLQNTMPEIMANILTETRRAASAGPSRKPGKSVRESKAMKKHRVFRQG